MVYVYTLTSKGEPRERRGHIVKRGDRYYLIQLNNSNQRICLPSKAGTLHNDAMWCTVSQKNVYIQRMLDILHDRRQKHIDAVHSCDKRIANITKGWESEN